MAVLGYVNFLNGTPILNNNIGGNTSVSPLQPISSGPTIPVTNNPNSPTSGRGYVSGQSRDRNSSNNSGYISFQEYSKIPLTPLLGTESNLRKEAFNKKQFYDTIDTSFNELGVTTKDVSTFDPSLATVGDFFTIYQTLFYQIPKEGDVNSHEFLILESTKYTQFVAQQEEIDALLAEIDDLREQNIALIADMSNQIKNLESAFLNAEANAEINSNLQG
tara:strand:+ start:40 stop:696 length:657 start_codon:yes stop_codon:yes gene_type:complete